MAGSASMLHVSLDDRIRVRATETLASSGLSLSDAVRMLLTRVARDGALPSELAADALSYDRWFRAKVAEAFSDGRTPLSHRLVMDEVQDVIDRKRDAAAKG